MFVSTFSPAANLDINSLNSIEKGERLIRDFYTPGTSSYFRPKVERFFNDSNLEILKIKIERVAKERKRSTKDVMTEVTCEEFTRAVFGELSSQLAAIKTDYRNQIKINAGISNSSGTETFLVAGGTMLAALGISAAIISTFSAMTGTVTGMYAAYVVYITASTTSIGTIITALLSGPWGWVILGGIVVSIFAGGAYYYNKLEKERLEMIEKLIIAIENQRVQLVANWRNSFL